MVRGSGKLVPFCRALLSGRPRDEIRERGGNAITSGRRQGSLGRQLLAAAAATSSSASSLLPVDGQTAVTRGFTSAASWSPSSGLVEGVGGGDGGGICFGSSRRFSAVVDIANGGGKSSDGDFSAEYPTRSDKSPPAASRRSPVLASSQSSDAPQHTPRNDRYFRSRSNSAVASMLRLLEAAPSQAEVEKILDRQITDVTVSSRWPWLPLLEALQRGPKPHLALEVFEWKRNKFDGGDPREYAKMIATAGKLNHLDIALSLFKEMEDKGVKRLPITCNALMSAFSRNGQIEEVLAIFREMLEGEDCKPTLVTYNTLISMYSKSNLGDMEKYFDMCKSSGFYPDRVTFNAMIWGYMRAGQFVRMEEMYEELKRSGSRPDPITFSALIIGFSKANEFEKVELTFNHMQEEGYPISTMIAEILSEYYAYSKKFDKLERIMKIASNTPGASCSSRVYGVAVQSYAESSRVLDMEETMDKMFTSNRLFTSAKTLEAVISCYASYSNFEGLALVLERIRSIGWVYQLSTYHTLLYEYGKKRELGRMEEVFKEMEDTVDVEPTEETYKILADSYRGAGDELGLKKIIDRMSAAGLSTKEVIETKVDRMWTDDEIYGGVPR